MSVTIPSLDPVTDILDTDKIMVTQQSGQTFTIDGASFNKRNQAVIASSTTLTGAPLKTGNIVRVYFTADITGVNTSTALSLSYNGSSKTVKVPKDGALVNFTAQNMGGSPTVYKYLQAYTTLELLYDGTNFVIIGNPVVISSSDYTIYADGSTKYTRTGSDKAYVPNNKSIYYGSREVDLVYGNNRVAFIVSSMYSGHACVYIACSNYNGTGTLTRLMASDNFSVSIAHKSNGVDTITVNTTSNYSWAVFYL